MNFIGVYHFALYLPTALYEILIYCGFMDALFNDFPVKPHPVLMGFIWHKFSLDWLLFGANRKNKYEKYIDKRINP